MWRSVFRRSQNASRNLAVTGITKKKIQSPSLTSLSRFSFLESSSGNASERNIRFFSATNPTRENPSSSAAKLTHEESIDEGFAKSSSFGVDATSAKAIVSVGAYQLDGEKLVYRRRVQQAHRGVVLSLSRFSIAESSGNGNLRFFSTNRTGKNLSVGAYKLDEEKVESVLSLLRSDEESLELGLKALDVDLHLELVVRVFESPEISGKNLIRFLKWATKKKEISGDISLVESLVVAIFGDTRRVESDALWDLVEEIGEKVHSSVLSLEILEELIALFGKLGKSKAAYNVFSKAEEFGFTPNAKTYYLTLEALCKESSMERACSVSLKMLKSGALPEGDQIGNIITWFCKEGKAKEAYSVYDLAKTKEKFPPPEPVATLISALCRMRNVKEAKALLLDMISKGPAPGNAVFNLIIHACSKTGNLDDAKEVLKLMESIGLKPDVYTYTVIISGYAKGGLMNEAQEILAEAKQKHEKLSPVLYHALIQGYCKIEEYDEALNLLSEMDRFGVQPNADEYNKLIESLCLKALDWEKAEMLFEEMKEKGLRLDAITQGLLRGVKEMALKTKGLQLDSFTQDFLSKEDKLITSLDAEAKNLLAQFFSRILASLARVFPQLGPHYRRWASGIYNSRNRIMDFVTFCPRGFTPRRTFTETEAVMELGRMLALLVFFVLMWDYHSLSVEVRRGDDDPTLVEPEVEVEVNRTALKILEVVSIPPISYPEEVWKAAGERLSRFRP